MTTKPNQQRPGTKMVCAQAGKTVTLVFLNGDKCVLDDKGNRKWIRKK